MEAKRVVLIEPGDTLLIGNAGEGLDSDAATAVGEALKALGVPCIMFSEAIDLDVLKQDDRG